MANARIDENNRPTIICASSADGTTVVRIQGVPSTHALMIKDGTGQSNNGNHGGIAVLDQNSFPVWTALSSDGLGNIVEVYGDAATGSVLTLKL